MPPTRTNGEPLTVIAELRFDPAHREAMLELARQHVRNTLAAEPGCLRFELVAPEGRSGRRWCSARCSRARPPSPRIAPRRTRPGSATRGRPMSSRPRCASCARVAPAWPGAVLCATPGAAPLPAVSGAALADAGIEVRWNDRGRALTEDELIERLDGVVATIAGLEPYTERVFAAAPGAQGGGPDGRRATSTSTSRPPRRHGVAVAMAFGTNHDAVADHALALMAAAAHRIAEYDRRVRAGGLGHAAARPAARDHGRRRRLRPHRPGGRQALPRLQHGGAGRGPGGRGRHRGPARLSPGRARRAAAPGRLRHAARAAHRRDPAPDRRAAAGADEADRPS